MSACICSNHDFYENMSQLGHEFLGFSSTEGQRRSLLVTEDVTETWFKSAKLTI